MTGYFYSLSPKCGRNWVIIDFFTPQHDFSPPAVALTSFYPILPHDTLRERNRAVKFLNELNQIRTILK